LAKFSVELVLAPLEESRRPLSLNRYRIGCC